MVALARLNTKQINWNQAERRKWTHKNKTKRFAIISLAHFLVDLISVKSKILVHTQRHSCECDPNLLSYYWIYSKPADSAHTVTHKQPSGIRTLLIRRKIKHWHIFKHIKLFCFFFIASKIIKEITLLMQFENINNHCPLSLWWWLIFNSL